MDSSLKETLRNLLRKFKKKCDETYLGKSQGSDNANKVLMTDNNGNTTVVSKIPSNVLPDTGVSVDNAKNLELSNGNLINADEVLKPFYNLGTYDTVTDNGDGTSTVIRGTYYNDDGTQSPLETQEQYEEKVLTNQPLLTLDKNGTRFLRYEWKKQLNLSSMFLNATTKNNVTFKISNDIVTTIGVASANGYCRFTLDNPLRLKAGTYTTLLTGCNDTFYMASGRYANSSDFDIKINKMANTFTFNNDIVIDNLSINRNVGVMYDETITIMINEGSDSYSYQPYYGQIVHLKDLDNINVLNENWISNENNLICADNTVLSIYNETYGYGTYLGNEDNLTRLLGNSTRPYYSDKEIALLNDVDVLQTQINELKQSAVQEIAEIVTGTTGKVQTGGYYIYNGSIDVSGKKVLNVEITGINTASYVENTSKISYTLKSTTASQRVFGTITYYYVLK